MGLLMKVGAFVNEPIDPAKMKPGELGRLVTDIEVNHLQFFVEPIPICRIPMRVGCAYCGGSGFESRTCPGCGAPKEG